MKKIDIGYVYLLSNPAMPGMVKIGFTCGETEKRVAELSSSTSVPLPFVMEYEVFVESPQKYEVMIHAKLKKYRVSACREFFNIDANDAIKCINKTIYGTEKELDATIKGIKELIRLAEKYPNRFKNKTNFDIEELKVVSD
ncbi:GIY-YIG nuclease family protein, partial [Vibrio fortis]